MMKTQTSLKILAQFVLAACVGITAACGGGPAPTSRPAQTMQTQHKARTPAYTGPVAIRFDTGLISPALASYGYRKTRPAQQRAFKDPGPLDFSIQALPDGPVVFQESFTKAQGPLEISREIAVTDTSKVYTLHVHNGDPAGEHKVTSAFVNINGHDWVRPNDFKGVHTAEIEKTSILLNASNTLNLTLNGQPGSTLTLTLVEGGSAGVIRRTNGPLNDHPTHAAHVQGNDRNIFDPDDPNSLGELEPFVQIPVSEDGRSLPSLSLNGGVPATVSAGELQLKVRQPVQQNLAQILERYQGVVIDEISSDEFQIFVNLDTVSLKALPNNLKALNALVDGESAIESVAFDSGQGAKMFALMVELLLAAQQGELIQALDVNPILFSNASRSFEGTATSGGQSMNAENSWWLTQTGVLDAWKHSMGFQRANNRPVRVAVVDSGFGELDKAMQANQDLQGQVLTSRMGSVYFYTTDDPKSNDKDVIVTGFPQQHGKGAFEWVLSVPKQQEFVSADAAQQSAHGTSQASTIASNINDQVGVVGVAPHAKIIPIKVGAFKPDASLVSHLGGAGFDIVLGWELRLALRAAGTFQADIVSITNSTVVNDIDNWLAKVNAVTTGAPYGWLDALQVQVEVLGAPPNMSPHSNHTICLFNAGNIGNHVRNTLPAGRLKNIVIVGAVSEEPGNSPPFQRALFFGNNTESLLFIGNSGSIARIDDTQSAASAWWTGGSTPNSPGAPSVSTGIANWESGLGQQNLKVWAPGTKMGAMGIPNHGPFEGQFIVREDWGGTSAATPFTAGALALLKALRPELNVPQLLSGNWVKFKTVQHNDNLLKDFYSLNRNRKGIRLSPFALSVPVIDVAATIADNPQLSTGNQTETVTGILRKASDNRPYLETAAGPLDLSMFVEDNVFTPHAAIQFEPPPDATRLSVLSQQLKQNSYAVFWNKVAFDITGNGTKNQNLINKSVRVTGWRYTAQNEPDHPHNLETVDLIREVAPMSISAAPPPDGTTIGGFAAKFIAPNTTKDFNPGDVAGVQLSGDLDDLSVKVGNIDVPILAVVNDLVAFGIPSNLPPDIYDAIISAAGGAVTLENAIRILAPQPSPTPTPSGSPPPGNQTVAAIVSSLVSGFHQPSNPTLFSALMNFVNPFGNSPVWVGLTPGTQAGVQYPAVPDIRNPGVVDTAIPLRVDIQVANNSSQGGLIRVISGSTSAINFPGTEGQIMTHTFPFGASEATGVNVTFEVSGTDPDAQIIFVIRAEP